MHFKKGWGVGVAALAVAVGVAGCTGPTAEPVDTSLLTIAGTTAVTYDPLHGGAQYYATPSVQAVYDTLLIWDQTDDSFDPWLASGYTLNDDKTVMEMTLRDDVDFIDGEHLNAEAIVKLLTLVRDTETQSVAFVDLAGGYGAEFEVTGEYTLTITTTKPIDHAIFQVLDTMPIPSPAALDDPDSLLNTPVGTGPYILDVEESTPGVELNYTRNEDYWNPDVYPYDDLVIKQYDDNIAALNALKSGQIDATIIDIGSAAEAEASGFKLTIGNGQYRIFRFGDVTGAINPAVGDLRVRQAIFMAFDREAISEALNFGYGGVIYQGFTEGQPAYIEGAGEEYAFDPERAKELLAEAGYPDGFELKIPTMTGFTTDMEPVVQQSLADIGITVVYEPQADFGAYLANYASYPVIMFVGEYFVNTITNHLKLGGAVNGWGTDEHLLELIDIIDVADGEERIEAGQELNQFLIDEAWLSPISEYPQAWATIPEIDVELEPLTASIRLQLLKPAE